MDIIVKDSYNLFLDNIYNNHLDQIYNFYIDIKNRFSISPFFLGKLKSTDLTEFIINLYELKYNLINASIFKVNKNILNQFKNYYNSELLVLYDLIQKLLKEIFFKIDLEYDMFVIFCYRYTDLHEIFFSK